MPHAPLTAASTRSLYAWLSILDTGEGERDGVLASRMNGFGASNQNAFLGFGANVYRFTDKQLVFGFDLEPLRPGGGGDPEVVVRFFDQTGRVLSRDHTIKSFGQYTFAESTEQHLISGFELINLGQVPVGIDNIVFEPQILLGWLN